MTNYSLVMIHEDGETWRQPVLAWVPQPDGTVMALVDMSRGWRFQRRGAYLRLKPLYFDYALEENESVWGYLADDVPLPTPDEVRAHDREWAKVRKQRSAPVAEGV